MVEQDRALCAQARHSRGGDPVDSGHCRCICLNRSLNATFFGSHVSLGLSTREWTYDRVTSVPNGPNLWCSCGQTKLALVDLGLRPVRNGADGGVQFQFRRGDDWLLHGPRFVADLVVWSLLQQREVSKSVRVKPDFLRRKGVPIGWLRALGKDVFQIDLIRLLVWHGKGWHRSGGLWQD
jgi:hypothetical protein